MVNQAEAFRSPEVLRNFDYEHGSNAPSANESEFAAVIRKRGRPDLAEHILWNSLKYRRLNDFLQLDIREVCRFEALQRAFQGDREEPIIRRYSFGVDVEEKRVWLEGIKATMSGDETLMRLEEESQDWLNGRPVRESYLNAEKEKYEREANAKAQ